MLKQILHLCFKWLKCCTVGFLLFTVDVNPYYVITQLLTPRPAVFLKLIVTDLIKQLHVF